MEDDDRGIYRNYEREFRLWVLHHRPHYKRKCLICKDFFYPIHGLKLYCQACVDKRRSFSTPVLSLLEAESYEEEEKRRLLEEESYG